MVIHGMNEINLPDYYFIHYSCDNTVSSMLIPLMLLLLLFDFCCCYCCGSPYSVWCCFSLPQLFVNIGISQIHMDVRRFAAAAVACTLSILSNNWKYTYNNYSQTHATTTVRPLSLFLIHSFGMLIRVFECKLRKSEKMGKIALNIYERRKGFHTHTHTHVCMDGECLWIEFIFGRIYICSKPSFGARRMCEQASCEMLGDW